MNRLIERCRESESFANSVAIARIALMVVIALV